MGEFGRRESSVAIAILVLGAVLALAAPSFFSRDNLSDLLLANLPVLIAALGMTLVILTGHIDVSIGSAFALCAVASGLSATAGVPLPAAALVGCVAGAVIGALNGALVAYLGIPSIVVTLAIMIVAREGLQWATGGAWIQDLPAGFQWLGMTAQVYPLVITVIVTVIYAALAWAMRQLAAGRAVYATGSSPEAARLAGLNTRAIVFGVFVASGALTGLAALLNSVRFNQIPSNTGLGLELKVIAAVVVGGAAISGGRGSALGTLLGVILLSAIGPALTFLGVSAYWERAIHGVIILAAVAIDAVRPVAVARVARA